MCAERSSNVTLSLKGTPQSSKARASIVKRLVSTFHDHSATPAAVSASRSCASSQFGTPVTSGLESFEGGTLCPVATPCEFMFSPAWRELNRLHSVDALRPRTLLIRQLDQASRSNSSNAGRFEGSS